MLFSPSARYAILALSYLAGQDATKPLSVASIAESAGVPAKFLAKILVNLKNSRILRAVKGPGGGYYLNREPEDILVTDIVTAVDPNTGKAEACVLGLDSCSDAHPCPLHFEWKSIRDSLDTKFNKITVKELSVKLAEKRAHLI